MEECQDILVSLFPSHVPSMTPNDPIDIWTVGLCEKLIDDAPVSDPRWGASIGRGKIQQVILMLLLPQTDLCVHCINILICVYRRWE